MASSSLFLRCLTIFTFITSITALEKYQLEEKYSGDNFFDAFNFFTAPDPTHGFVTYVSESAASQQGLISVRSDGVYMGVDFKTVLSPSGAGRNSVRIESKKSWTHGLFVADLGHVPGGACGSWPAMWTVGDNWPYNGEIDIIEGVNLQNHNLMSLHSGPTCSVAGSGQTGTLQSANCNNFANPVGVGCGISDPRTNSYGTGFNLNGGGIYAMEWTSCYIRVYFFPAGTSPADINGANPDPSKWGTPVANFQGDCDIDSHFRENRLIFDTTFCGDWASAVWSSDATCGSKAPTCVDYVAGNPAAFGDQYWLVKSISVYQLGNIATPEPSSTPVSTSAPSPEPAPSSSISPVPLPSPVSSQSQNSPAPVVTPSTPINTPTAQPSSGSNGNSATQPSSQPNGNPVAEINPTFSQLSDFTGNIQDFGEERTNFLTNILPTPPALPSVFPAGELLGVGSGVIPTLDLDINAENFLNAAKEELNGQLQGLIKQAVGWSGDDYGATESPSDMDADADNRGTGTSRIVSKPFYPDEAGNVNATAGSVASPKPVLNLGSAAGGGGIGGANDGIVAFEGGAKELVCAGLLVWSVVLFVGGLIMI
ncbi:hypothetical protein SS1G_11977 [Sclerotinia sclerotiorum 1980 UF-70]|uniref:endo-1,3(4)-beta-glucanase n=2 Tax=Sclerotinia sclerotiorum (strain ATCC 18683 / 1980 / Ss-1) TaxID=665079 RepID=A0A1D9QHG8_SCLS1|nr:hypothetical protein SS1G_11977 [Sclerotinia sclerotiorum 1980 UF-70]APA14232.1 hypothetical protein sscle_12g090020 [Sclerotinia sclerotiorum 1980 UF-70]EDN97452.1 hypothetical protein SS1G_11977 [Sclerotinia sclerotiorum 1980 UF-70]